MLKIGQLKITGDGKWPRSRVAMKKELRGFAKELGLELKFVTRKKKTMSWCNLSKERALICEGTAGHQNPMPEVIFHGLHEIAHWIQYNEGMFQNYLGTPYYDGWKYPKASTMQRIALRAERHADWLAKKLAIEMFGAVLVGESCYDDAQASKAFFKGYYTDD